MLLNERTAISTSSVLLVPYSKWHVPSYHEWMKDEEIQEATASEPLSLEEEYSMQASWRRDHDKLTFIVCLPVSDAPTLSAAPDEADGNGRSGCTLTLTERDDSSDRMIGDVNLFLRVDDGEEGDSNDPQIIGEVELMIAEKGNQRKGFGRATLLSFLRYLIDHEGAILSEFIQGDAVSAGILARGGSDDASRKPLRFSCLSVKIGKTNERSLTLFESLLFRKLSETPSYFGEFELRRTDLNRGTVDGELERAAIVGYTEMHYGRQQ